MRVTSGQPESPRTIRDVVVSRDVRIPAGDPSITLAADVWLPSTDHPVPAVVMLLPYRKDFLGGLKYEAAHRFFAQHGYACVLADARGIGSSDGVMSSMLDTTTLGDDGAAVVRWAARQTWCTGQVGMWGHCAGGLSTLATAHRRPPELKAIIAQAAPYDVKYDAMYPARARSVAHNVVRRAGTNLLFQLMPSLRDPWSAEEQQRWRERLRHLNPARMAGYLAPEDPVWEEWALDPDRIAIPVLCTTGWRDIYTDPIVRLYERLRGPKKLLVGPWMHTLPHESPDEALDYLPMLLRWWNHWLRDEPNGLMDEAPVTVFVQGHRPEWRNYHSWPPGDSATVLSACEDTTLRASAAPDAATSAVAIATYEPDPTIGTATGLCNIGAGRGLPLDQSDDDHRAACFTSEPLAAELAIAGDPQVVVHLVDDHPHVERIVVRLCDVDADGRSTLITGGLSCPDGTARSHTVPMRRTAYRVATGHRLRVALSDSEFPFLQPLSAPIPIRIAGISLTMPVAAASVGSEAVLPMLSAMNQGHAQIPPGFGGQWSITRQPIPDSVQVSFGSRLEGLTPASGHHFDLMDDTSSTVRCAQPESSAVVGSYRCVATMHSGETISATARIRCTRTALWIRAEVTIDDETVYANSWWEASMETGGAGHCNGKVRPPERPGALRAGMILQ